MIEDGSDRRRIPIPTHCPGDPYASIARALADIATQWEIANMIAWRRLKHTTNFPNSTDDTEIERRLGMGRKNR